MDPQDFYLKLKTTLDQTTTFPSKYLYKFIIPNSKTKIDQIQNIFNHLGAVIETKPSKNGNYISISVLVLMQNANQVIEKYREAGKIEGIVSL